MCRHLYIQWYIYGIRPSGIISSLTAPTFTGSDGTNAGILGLVPPPSATQNGMYLRGDGVWAAASIGTNYTMTNLVNESVTNLVGNSGSFTGLVTITQSTSALEANSATIPALYSSALVGDNAVVNLGLTTPGPINAAGGLTTTTLLAQNSILTAETAQGFAATNAVIQNLTAPNLTATNAIFQSATIPNLLANNTTFVNVTNASWS